MSHEDENFEGSDSVKNSAENTNRLFNSKSKVTPIVVRGKEEEQGTKVLKVDNTQEQKQASSPYKQNFINCFAGSAAGMAEVLINHPLFSIKLDMQSGELKKNKKSAAKFIRGLYRGMGPNMFSMVPITSIQITTGHFVESKLNHNAYVNEEATKAFSGFIGGLASAFFAGPVEFYLTQQRIRNSGNHSKGAVPEHFFQVVKSLNQSHGVTVCRKGLAGTAARDAIFTMGYFSALPWFRDILEKNDVPTTHAAVIASLTTGAMVAAGTQPLALLLLTSIMLC